MAITNVQINFGDLESFLARIRQASRGDFEKEMKLFLESLGTEFLRLVQDEIIRRDVTDTRLLLHSFTQGDKDNVWISSNNGLTLEVGTNLEYAAFVNDGHWTCKKGEKSRFVPGTWQGDHFIYNKNADTGMVLKQQWVEGAKYWEEALRLFEYMYPELLAKKFDKWLRKYFCDFM